MPAAIRTYRFAVYPVYSSTSHTAQWKKIALKIKIKIGVVLALPAVWGHRMLEHNNG